MRQPRGDGGVIANGRLALADVAVSPSAAIELALWSRNLLDEQHLMFKPYNPLVGLSGYFNERRTIGLELGVRF